MKSMSRSKILSVILFGVLLNGCAKESLEKPIIEACVELVSEQAYCAKTYLNTERLVEAHVWREERKQRISIRTEDLAKVFNLLGKVCADKFECKEETEKLKATYNILKSQLER